MGKGMVPKAVRIEAAFSTMSNADIIDTAAQIGKTALKSAKYKIVAVKSAVDAVVEDGVELAAAAADATAKQQAADVAKLARDTLRQKANRDAGLLVKAAETNCTTDAEVHSLGLSPRAQNTNSSAGPPPAPTQVTVASGDVVGGASVHCKSVKGVTVYRVEVSPDPMGPNTFVEVPGTYARRKLTGLVSGGKYWVRVACVRGNRQGEWSTPVMVIAR